MNGQGEPEAIEETRVARGVEGPPLFLVVTIRVRGQLGDWVVQDTGGFRVSIRDTGSGVGTSLEGNGVWSEWKRGNPGRCRPGTFVCPVYVEPGRNPNILVSEVTLPPVYLNLQYVESGAGLQCLSGDCRPFPNMFYLTVFLEYWTYRQNPSVLVSVLRPPSKIVFLSASRGSDECPGRDTLVSGLSQDILPVTSSRHDTSLAVGGQ